MASFIDAGPAVSEPQGFENGDIILTDAPSFDRTHHHTVSHLRRDD